MNARQRCWRLSDGCCLKDESEGVSKAISRVSLKKFRSHVQLGTTFLSSLLLRMLAKPLPACNLDHTCVDSPASLVKRAPRHGILVTRPDSASAPQMNTRIAHQHHHHGHFAASPHSSIRRHIHTRGDPPCCSCPDLFPRRAPQSRPRGRRSPCHEPLALARGPDHQAERAPREGAPCRGQTRAGRRAQGRPVERALARISRWPWRASAPCSRRCASPRRPPRSTSRRAILSPMLPKRPDSPSARTTPSTIHKDVLIAAFDAKN